jgi:D-alanine-D-alanine ligase-like ATP-grasp enzyme
MKYLIFTIFLFVFLFWLDKPYKKTNRCSLTNNKNVKEISNNKILTKLFLKNLNVPVPKGFEIQGRHYPSIVLLDDLLKKNKLNFPVVLKKTYGMQGNGVFTNVQNSHQLNKLINNNNKYGVLIEEHLKSRVYRVLYVNGILFDIVYRTKPYVIGDGKSILHSLIKNIHTKQNISFLKAQGITLNTIIKKNKKIYLTDIINARNGATTYKFDKTKIHKDNKDILDKVMLMLNAKCIGFDIMSNDLSIPFNINNGKIIEINSSPGTTSHRQLDKTFSDKFNKILRDS